MEEQYLQFHEGNKMGIQTADGRMIIPAVYDFVVPVSDGLFNVREGNYTAYFDTEGNEVLPFSNQYESYGNFTEGLARVKFNDKWGFINREGVEVIAPQFHYADEFSDGLAIVRNEHDLHAAIPSIIPVALGFYGYNPEKYTTQYMQYDIETVVSYLKEQ